MLKPSVRSARRPFPRATGVRVGRAKSLVARDAAQQHEPRLLQPQYTPDASSRRLLLFLPGMDGTGQAITTQLPSLTEAGFDVRCLYIPPQDRSTWDQLTAKTVALLREALAGRPPRADGGGPQRATLVAESFGGCLALRVAAAAPQLLEAVVVSNPATCFGDSLGGLAALVAATNLLGLFPEQLYNIAQGVMLPLLVDTDRVAPGGVEALRAMISMTPPPDMLASKPNRPIQLPRWSLLPSQATPAPPPPAVGPLPGLPTAADLYAPAAGASHRANMLRDGGLSDDVLRGINVPTLVIASARDRLLPSLVEGARLQRVMPSARRLILPNSSHTALLERDVLLVPLLRRAGFLPLRRPPNPPAPSSAPSTPPPGPPATPTSTPSGQRNAAAPQPPPQSSSTGTAASPVAAAPPPPSATASLAAAAAAAVAAAESNGTPPGLEASQMGSSSRPAASSNTAPAMGNGRSSSHTRAANATASNCNSTSNSTSNSASSSSTTTATTSTAGQAASSTGAPASSNPTTEGWQAGPPAATGGSAGAEGQGGGMSLGLTDDNYDEWAQRLAAYRELVSPVVLGAEVLPDAAVTAAAGQAVLFVGNHGKMGLYDTPLLVYELYMRGFKVSGLAHPGHWAGPMGDFFERFGAVRASPKAAYELLRSGRNVLLFPGGAREVTKKVGEEYQLFWRDTPDFVRMASRMGAIIVPFAAVGADDAYDIMLEVEEVLSHPLLGPAVRGLLQRLDPRLRPEESILPITRLPGLGLPVPVPVPNLQRLYYKFCAPIDTRLPQYSGGRRGPAAAALYAEVRAAVEGGMGELLALRAADAESQVGARLQRGLEKWLPAFGIAAASNGASNWAGSSAAAADPAGAAAQAGSKGSDAAT